MSGAEKLVEQIIETLNKNKGVNIVKIDLRRIENCFCSFFVICHGTSNTHVASLTDFVYDEANEKLGEKPLHVEGETTSPVGGVGLRKCGCTYISKRTTRLLSN